MTNCPPAQQQVVLIMSRIERFSTPRRARRAQDARRRSASRSPSPEVPEKRVTETGCPASHGQPFSYTSRCDSQHRTLFRRSQPALGGRRPARRRAGRPDRVRPRLRQGPDPGPADRGPGGGRLPGSSPARSPAGTPAARNCGRPWTTCGRATPWSSVPGPARPVAAGPDRDRRGPAQAAPGSGR